MAKPNNSLAISQQPKPAFIDWILEQVTILAAAFGEVPQTERMKIYASELMDIPEEKLERAIKRAIRECRFFPKIAEIRQLAGADAESESEGEMRKAWQVTVEFASKWVGSDVHGNYRPMQGVRTSPMPQLAERILDTVKRSGGWIAYKNIHEDAFPFQQKRFFEEYAAWDAVNSFPDERLSLPGEIRHFLQPLSEINAEKIPEKLSKKIVKAIPQPLPPEEIAKRRNFAKDELRKWVERKRSGQAG